MRTLLVDFDTDPGRHFEAIRPIGVLLEREGGQGFESRYLEAVTESGDSGFDNYERTMAETQEFRDQWNTGESPGVTVKEYFTYLADNSYLGLRLRTLGMVEDAATLEQAFERYVVQAEPLPELDDEEFPQV